MKIGDLRHRIAIQQSASTSDGIGGFTEEWILFAEVYASVWPSSGKETVSGTQLQGEITHKVRIRSLDGVIPKMRIIFNGRTLEIIEPPINWQERGIYMDLLCRELV